MVLGGPGGVYSQATAGLFLCACLGACDDNTQEEAQFSRVKKVSVERLVSAVVLLCRAARSWENHNRDYYGQY